jgi:hypothetical protein
MSKAALATNALGTTDPSNTVQNGGVDPWVAPNACTITDISVACAQVAVFQGTVGATVSLRMDVYTMTAGARSLLSTQRINISPVGSVGVSNSLGTNATFTGQVTGLSLSLTAQQWFGIQFTPETDANTHAESVGRLYGTITTSE